MVSHFEIERRKDRRSSPLGKALFSAATRVLSVALISGILSSCHVQTARSGKGASLVVPSFGGSSSRAASSLKSSAVSSGGTGGESGGGEKSEETGETPAGEDWTNDAPGYIRKIIRNVSAERHFGPATYPKVLTTPYSPDNPSGDPHFSEKQKQDQRERLRTVVNGLKAAIASGKDSYTIPPGDYRANNNLSLVLNTVRRADDNPFTIYANGVTFWAEGNGSIISMSGCSNIVFEGLTIDRDNPRTIAEAKILEIDQVHKRIRIQPFEDTTPMRDVMSYANAGTGCRAVFFNHDGTMLNSYYSISGGGPGSCHLASMSAAEQPNSYWIYFVDPKITSATYDPEWYKTYGDSGTLQAGDLVAIYYSRLFALSMNYCKNIVFNNLSIYCYASTSDYNGGGNNYFIGCNFCPKPGTYHLVGGDALYGGYQRKGTVYYNTVVGAGMDDMSNVHGTSGNVTEIGTHYLSFASHPLTSAGEHVVLYNVKTGTKLATLAADRIEGTTVYFSKDLTSLNLVKEQIFAVFPEYLVENMRIENCFLLNGYQSCGMEGSSISFRNNIVTNLGSAFQHLSYFSSDNSNQKDFAMVDNILVENNVFLNCGLTPGKPSFSVSYTGGDQPLLRNITYRNNLVVNTAIHSFRFSQVDGLNVSDNILVNPWYSYEAMAAGYGKATSYTAKDRQAVTLATVRNAFILNNSLFEDKARTAASPVTKSKIVGYSPKEKANVRVSGDRYYFDASNAVANRTRELVDPRNRLYASAVIDTIRREFLK